MYDIFFSISSRGTQTGQQSNTTLRSWSVTNPFFTENLVRKDGVCGHLVEKVFCAHIKSTLHSLHVYWSRHCSYFLLMDSAVILMTKLLLTLTFNSINKKDNK